MISDMTNRNQSVAYINNANGVILDAERTNVPPKKGDSVAFLETEGQWCVGDVERAEGRFDRLVYVDRRG